MALLTSATLLALARVVVGVHYLGDVAAGAALGAAAALLTAFVARAAGRRASMSPWRRVRMIGSG